MATNIDLTEQVAAQANAQRLRDSFAAFERGNLDYLRDNAVEDGTWINAGSSRWRIS